MDAVESLCTGDLLVQAFESVVNRFRSRKRLVVALSSASQGADVLGD